MSEKYTFTIYGEPIAKGRPRFTKKGFTYTPSKTRKAEAEVKDQIISQLPKGFIVLDGKPIRLITRIVKEKPKSAKKTDLFPIARPDLDNYLKLVLDAMNTVVFHDDSAIVEILARKEYGEKPHIKVSVEVLEVPSAFESVEDSVVVHKRTDTLKAVFESINKKGDVDE